MANKLYWGPADFYCTHTCGHWHSRFSIKDHDCRETGSGNLIFRTICNSEKGKYGTAAVNLPEGRVAACFGLEALRGETAFVIDAENGSFTLNLTMGKESFSDLELAGPGVFYIRTIGSFREGFVTVRVVDAPKS